MCVTSCRCTKNEHVTPPPSHFFQITVFKSLSHNIFENLAFEDWSVNIYTVNPLQCNVYLIVQLEYVCVSFIILHQDI